ncbi:methyltransferase family protein [Pyrococcus kukulkanii]|uniref:methyltransferase family protein n=1 Tax=Pyrococcus kukulkanii TaxID=1609559 RepID=UPI00356AB352
MESSKFRRIVFAVFFLLIPISAIFHVPVGRLSQAMHIARALILAITVPLAIYIHSLFPKKHDRPEDFKELLTNGPYKYVRHPFYSAFIFMGFGIALFFSSIPGLFCYLLMLPLWNRLAELEEMELLEYWGEEYGEFMKTRGRFLPKLNIITKQ